MKHGKKYQDSVKLIDHLNQYDPDQAAQLVVSTGKAKFDETVEVSIRLGVDPRHADQQVRGAVVLPHGTGRSIRVLVIAKGAKADEARAAGADYVGDQDMITKIQTENWFDFDVCVATPDMMGLVGRIGRVLGPKGLMPNPKSGTVTMDVAKALSEFAKTSKLLEVRHGSLEGKVLNSAQIEELAKLPSKEQLLGQLLGTMNAVPTNLVSLMANMIRPLLYALKAIEEKKAA